MSGTHSQSFALATTVALVIAFMGCGGARHVPAATSAHGALEATLSAWKEGKSVGRVGTSIPAIQAEDGEWRAKKKLLAFEIVGEEPSQTADAPRRFKVRLTVEGASPVDAGFIVFGNDPIFVYRDKDYETHFSKM